MKNLLLYALLSALGGCVEAKFGDGVNTDFIRPSTVSGLVPAHMSIINSATVTVEGTCEDGATVEFSGTGLVASDSVECVSGTFSIALDFTAGFTSKEFSIVQVDEAGNESDPELVTYERIEFYPTSLAAGGENTCAKVSGGGIKCWGAGIYGQVGNNSSADASTPEVVSYVSSSSLSSVGAYDVGSEHACAVDSSGAIYCWGNGYQGRMGNGSSASNNVLAASSASSVPDLVSDIAAGGAHTCAINTVGGVYCTGSNSDGQLGPAVVGDSTVFVNVQQSSASLTGITDITAGSNHTCAVKSNNSVICWGDNISGQLGNGTTTDSAEPVSAQATSAVALTGIVDVEAGGEFTCALKSSGTGGGVLCWGIKDKGQLGNGTSGTTPSSEAVSVSGLTNISQIAVGLNHACALKSDETVACWGDNSAGQLGADRIAVPTSDVPEVVEGLTRVVGIAAGDDHTCALTDYGSVFCWGFNSKGQLGDSTTTSSDTPVLVEFP